MSERKESLMRILVAIISGIVLAVWFSLVKILFIIHWFYVLFANKRLKGLAEFSEIWTSQAYDFIEYMTFMTNKRPFPFSSLKKNMSKYVK